MGPSVIIAALFVGAIFISMSITMGMFCVGRYRMRVAQRGEGAQQAAIARGGDIEMLPQARLPAPSSPPPALQQQRALRDRPLPVLPGTAITSSSAGAKGKGKEKALPPINEQRYVMNRVFPTVQRKNGGGDPKGEGKRVAGSEGDGEMRVRRGPYEEESERNVWTTVSTFASSSSSTAAAARPMPSFSRPLSPLPAAASSSSSAVAAAANAEFEEVSLEERERAWSEASAKLEGKWEGYVEGDGEIDFSKIFD